MNPTLMAVTMALDSMKSIKPVICSYHGILKFSPCRSMMNRRPFPRSCSCGIPIGKPPRWSGLSKSYLAVSKIKGSCPARPELRAGKRSVSCAIWAGGHEQEPLPLGAGLVCEAWTSRVGFSRALKVSRFSTAPVSGAQCAGNNPSRVRTVCSALPLRSRAGMPRPSAAPTASAAAVPAA